MVSPLISSALVDRILSILETDDRTRAASLNERRQLAESLSRNQLLGYTVDDISDADLQALVGRHVDDEQAVGRLRPVPSIEELAADLGRSAPNDAVRQRIRSLVAKMTEDERLSNSPNT